MGGSSSSGGGATVVEIDIAQPGFALHQATATAQAGVVTLKAMNPQSTPHNISIESERWLSQSGGPERGPTAASPR